MMDPSRPASSPRKTIIVVGLYGTGKTSLVRRFESNTTHSGMVTIGVNDYLMNIESHNYFGSFRLHIMDSNGNKMSQKVAKRLYQRVDGIMLVYSITDTFAFEELNSWLFDIKTSVGDKVPILIVGTGLDLERYRDISFEKAKKFGQENGCEVMETSVLDYERTTECFMNLISKMARNEEKEALEEYGFTPFHKACYYQQIEVVKSLIEVNPEFTIEKSKQKRNGLHIACAQGHLDVAKLIIDHKTTVLESKDQDGLTPFLVACSSGKYEIVSYLLIINPRCINEKSKNGDTGLHFACSQGWTSIAELLVVHQADLFCKNQSGWSPFHLACREGKTKIVEELLRSNPELLHEKTNDGKKGFLLAPISMQELLLNNHLSNFIQRNARAEPLQNWSLEVKKIIHLEFNQNFLISDACKNGEKELLAFYIDLFPLDIMSKDLEGNTPLHIACRHENRKCLVLLLQNGFISSPNPKNLVPMKLVREENKECFQTLFKVYERKQQKEHEFIICIINHQLQRAKRMFGTVNQETLLLGALHCIPWTTLQFFKELPIEDYRTIVKDTTLINVALDLRNKEVFEFLLGKCGGEQERCDLLQEACLTSRKDRLEWLLNTFKCESNKLPLNELFYLSKDICTDVLIRYLVPNHPDHIKLVEVFCKVPFSSSTVKIPPSPLITTEIAELFPWRSMSSTPLTNLNLSNCSLTQLPSGLSYLDEQVVVKINLKGNPLLSQAKAISEGGNAKDVILMMKETKRGGVELKEKKVLVVGDAAVGKTTLLEGLKGKVSANTIATDGVEISELELEGMVLRCWDFAGQEVYRYTHQIFLSDSATYLVMFNFRDSVSSIFSQLTYWLDLVTHRAPASQIILLGTHASVASEEIVQNAVTQVTRKFGGFVRGKVLVVDSLTGVGLENVKEALVEVAKQNPLRVPRLFEEIRQLIQSRQFDPFVEANWLRGQLEKKGSLEGLTDNSWKWSLRVLHCLGIVVLVDWESYLENRHTSTTFVIPRPSWLIGVFRTVVTLRNTPARDGVVSIEKLRRYWREHNYDVSVHDLLLEALEKFDVVSRLSGRGEGKVVVPCLLPDSAPEDFWLWAQNGNEAFSCLGLDGQLSWSFRRSFLLKEKKKCFPVGVMGKGLASLFRWGKVRHVWRAGCVITNGNDKTVVGMWEGWCGSRAGIHFVFYGMEDSEKEEGDDSPSLSPSLPLSSVSSQSPASPPSCPRSLLLLSSPPKSLVNIIKLLQQSTQMMQNLLEDFYKVDYEAVIPFCVDEQGVPLEWVKSDRILHALYLNKIMVEKEGREGHEKGTVSVGGLAPDLMLNQGLIHFVDEKSIVYGGLLGEGGYGEVFEATIPWQNEQDERNEKNEDNGSLTTRKVAVKKILLDKLLQRDNFEEILKMFHHETLFLLQMRHPNVVELVGMCSQSMPPLLLFELLDGDLLSSLTDPLGLKPLLNKFFNFVGILVRDNSKWDDVLSSIPGPSEEGNSIMKEFRDVIKKWPDLHKEGEELILQAAHYIDEGKLSSSGLRLWTESQNKFFDFYLRSREEYAPLSLTGVLRIAADITQGLHYLHSHDMIHRDLKGPNIFLTRSLLNGGGIDEYASHHVVAKLGDFGLSLVLSGPHQLRAQGKIKHLNHRWTAPEILTGRDYSKKSDVYSVGIILWETRYREMAFDSLGTFEQELKVKISQGARPKCLYSDEFDNIMKKCWCASPSERNSAEQTYSAIRSLSSSLAPSLFPNLPPIVPLSTPSHQPHHFSNKGKFIKKIELPERKKNEGRSHRVTCLTTCGGEIWGGCQSGYVFCYGGREEGTEGEERKDEELTLCYPSQLPGEADAKTVRGICGIVGEKGELAWAGSENGWITVWESGFGSAIGEEVKFFAPLLSGFRPLRRIIGDDCYICLELGELRWRKWVGTRIEEGRLSMKRVEEVREMEGGVGVVVVEVGGRERRFEMEEKEVGGKGLECLRFVLFCLGRKRGLRRVGGVKLGKRVLGLGLVDGRVWSFDESFQIREWTAKPDSTGVQTRKKELSELRSLSLTNSFLKKLPFSCFFPVGQKEIYIFFKNYLVLLERTSSIEEKEGEGKVTMGRTEDMFEGKGGEREEVWCGVYFRLRREVWVGTSEGWVWRKGEKLEKKKICERIGVGVRAMVIVGTQIWCGTTDSEIYQFDAINFSLIKKINLDAKKQEKEEKEEKENEIQRKKGQIITSFAVNSEEMKVWAGSLDRSITLWS